MEQSMNWQDQYTNTRYRKILTEAQLHIPGLCLFGRQIRTAATESLPLHHHDDNFEITLIVSGCPAFYTEHNLYPLTGGDVFVTRPDQPHGTNQVPVSISEVYWMQLDLHHCDHLLFLDRTASESLRTRFSNLPSPKISTDAAQTCRLVQTAFDAALQGADPQLVSQYLSLFLYLVLDFSVQPVSRLTPDIARTVSYIQTHITDALSLDALASLAFLSTSQFKQKFKKQMGIAPRHYINTEKMEAAKKMLLQGMTCQQTAAALHFESSAYFSFVFKQYCSCTPTEYRRIHTSDSSS